MDKFTSERLFEKLASLGISFNLYRHKAVFSVSESADLDAKIPGTHTRNLFLRDKSKRMFLLTLRSATPVDLGKLSTLIGSGRLSFGSPDRLMTYLGVTPGSVTPFAVVNDKDHKVLLLLDREMMEQELVNFHPLVNTMTIGLTPRDLMIFLGEIGCQPQIVDLAAAA